MLQTAYRPPKPYFGATRIFCRCSRTTAIFSRCAAGNILRKTVCVLCSTHCFLVDGIIPNTLLYLSVLMRTLLFTNFVHPPAIPCMQNDNKKVVQRAQKNKARPSLDKPYFVQNFSFSEKWSQSLAFAPKSIDFQRFFSPGASWRGFQCYKIHSPT